MMQAGYLCSVGFAELSGESADTVISGTARSATARPSAAAARGRIVTVALGAARCSADGDSETWRGKSRAVGVGWRGGSSASTSHHASPPRRKC